MHARARARVCVHVCVQLGPNVCLSAPAIPHSLAPLPHPLILSLRSLTTPASPLWTWRRWVSVVCIRKDLLCADWETLCLCGLHQTRPLGLCGLLETLGLCGLLETLGLCGHGLCGRDRSLWTRTVSMGTHGLFGQGMEDMVKRKVFSSATDDKTCLNPVFFLSDKVARYPKPCLVVMAGIAEAQVGRGGHPPQAPPKP